MPGGVSVKSVKCMKCRCIFHRYLSSHMAALYRLQFQLRRGGNEYVLVGPRLDIHGVEPALICRCG